jgi:hypothetical protein
MTKQELLDKLNSSDELVRMAFVPVSEVIKWVDELEENNNTTITDELISSIVSEIEGLDMDIISDYELSMRYREVELDNISLDSGNIEEAVRQAIKNNQ